MEVTYRCGNGHRNKVILQGNKDAHQKAPHHLETDGTQAAPENAVCPGEVNRTMTITSPRSGPHSSRVKSVQQKQATWKNISPLLINGKHFSTPTERKQSSCMKQKVKSQKKNYHTQKDAWRASLRFPLKMLTIFMMPIYHLKESQNPDSFSLVPSLNKSSLTMSAFF